MRRSRLFVWSTLLATCGGAFALSAASVGCADEDPKYGPPEAIRGRTINYGTGAAPPEPEDAGGNTTPKTARQLFDDLYATFTGNAPNGTCIPCHAPGGTGSLKFADPSKDAAYTMFKDKKYYVLTTPNGFYNKGVHGGGGPDLTAAQKKITESWSAAELKAGAPP